ncbi:hypothetical protein PIB30_012516 [Stylosanthes scabra]|uniref:Uncharacterized protein n=1 Tax=Stylosanthes scabra TaxID=79078 RepID=A0ABU6U5J5_9FABA|nr:hypothetical protein [Stylosanthes scabra]
MGWAVYLQDILMPKSAKVLADNVFCLRFLKVIVGNGEVISDTWGTPTNGSNCFPTTATLLGVAPSRHSRCRSDYTEL